MSAFQDSTFSGISASMDPSLMRLRLQDALQKKYGTPIEVLSSRILDVKYEPGKQVVILYRFKTKGPDHPRSQRKLYAGKLLREDESFPDAARDGNGHAWIALQDPKMILFPFPYDPVMTWLPETVEPELMKRRLNQIWSPEKRKVHKFKAELLDYTPQMRAAFLYQLRIEDKKTGHIEEKELIGKTHGFKEPQKLFAGAWALWQACGDRVGLARPMGYLSSPRLTLQEKVAGERLGGLVDRPNLSSILIQTARQIAALHSVRIPLHLIRRVHEEVGSLNRWSGVLAKIQPDLRERIEKLRGQIASEIERRMEIKGPVHADFHHTNILVDHDRIHLIDLDEMAYGDPALDIGRFLASLRIPSLRVFGNLYGLEEASQQFLVTYLKEAPQAELEKIRLFEAAGLITSAASAFRIQRPEWEREVSLILDEAEQTFSKAREKHPVAPSPERLKRPKLRHEEKIRWASDGTLMRSLLDRPVREIYGADLLVCEVCEVESNEDPRRIRYKLKGEREGQKWRGEVEGRLWKKENAFQLYQKLRENSPAEVLTYLPRLSMILTKSSGLFEEKLASETEKETSNVEVRSLKILSRVLLKHAQGNTLLVTDRNPGFVKQLGQDLLKAEIIDLSDVDTVGEGKFKTIILMEVLENLEDEEASKLLKRIWDGVEKKGKLFVVVPNEEAHRHPHQLRTFSRKTLKKILKPLGSPKVLTDQPYKWLILYVKKQPLDRPPHPPLEFRFEATAEICRGRVLELGCGRGHLAKVIHNHGHAVTAVDKNGEKITWAQEHCPAVNFIQGDILKLSLPKASFDTVILPEILEHVPEATGHQMLEASWSFVKPRGRLIVSVPNENCIPHPNHLRQFDRPSLSHLLEVYGKPQLVAEQPFKWLMMYVEKTES